MKQDQEHRPQPRAAARTRRTLWRRFTDNLKEWRQYLRRRRAAEAAACRVQKRRRKTLAQRVTGLRRDLRHQVSANRHRHFPESDKRVVQLLLFMGGSVPRVVDRIRQSFHFRRKRRIHHRGDVQARLERVRLHPVLFLGGALAVAAVCALLSLYALGVDVSYNEYHLASVPGKRTVARAVERIEAVTRRTLDDADYTVDTDALTLTRRIVPRRSLVSRDTLTERLITQLGLVEYANVLYVDDEPVVATTHAGAIEELLEQLKIGYVTADTVDCRFVERIAIRQEYVDARYVMNLGYIAEILNATKVEEVSYTVKAGDTPLGISASYDIPLDDLKLINPGYDWTVLRVGDQLTISRAIPYLTVVNVERQDYVQDVPYEVTYTDDDTMYQGDYKVVSKGEFGKADISANVTYVNGEETARELVASVTLRRPVAEQQLRGTKERPSWFPTGSFRWPCNGIITSGFGPRNTGIRGASTYHEGIDIANGYGTSIYASDGGTVTHAGWMGGYGYLVIIDHGNGYQTYYGHCSSLSVSVGDHVFQGQLIAHMGSTGISSGTHCDFRIKLNGTFLNPMNFLS